MSQAKKCMHCGHPIKKVYFISQGQSMWGWRHTYGGRYCKIGGEYGGCLCSNAEPEPTTRSGAMKCGFCKSQITGEPVRSLDTHGFIVFCSDKCKSTFYSERINKGLCPACNIPLIDGVCPTCGYNAEGMRFLEEQLGAGAQSAVTTSKEAATEVKCPNCGETNPEMLDWRWDDKNNTVYECFECGHTWEVPHVV